MAEPSLSEITNFRVDPDLGGSSPRVIIDNAEMIRNLNQTAQYQSENSWRKYNQFQQSLSDIYKNLNDTAGLETMTQDQPILKKEMADIFEEINKDPKSALAGGKNYNEIQQRLVQLKQNASTSKKDYLFDQAHREFLSRNPELNTEQNNNKFDQFGKLPLGQRKPFTLDMPVIFDVGSYTKGITDSATQKYNQDAVYSENDPFIKTFDTGTKINKDDFLKRWLIGYDLQTDKNNQPIKSAQQQTFKNLPPDVQDMYNKKAANGDGVREFFKETGEREFDALGKPDANGNIIIPGEAKVTSNPNYLDKENLALKKADIAQGWARLGLEKAKIDKADNEDVVSADNTLREAISIIDKGTPIVIENFDGKRGNNKKMVQIAEPTLLQTFGNIDKDGKTTNVPNEVFYDKGKGQLNLTYYKKDDNGNIALKDGKKVVDHVTPLDERTWLKTMAKRSNPNKDIGTVNSIVDEVLTKSGNSLFKVSEFYKGNTQQAAEITLTGNENPSTLQPDKVYILDGVKVKWNGKNLVKQK